MLRPRIIPVLLLNGRGLIKSIKFGNYRYIGDPINAVKIFNDLKVDELVFLDVMATREKRSVSLEFVNNVGEEANMPFAVGGGIKTIAQIRSILAAGAEKVIIGSIAAEDPDFIRVAADNFGSSTITVCMDIKKTFFGSERVWITNGKKRTCYNPLEFAQLVESKGAGEIIVQSISQDGLMKGYDLQLIKGISEHVKIPVIALGGAGTLQHLKQAHYIAYASGLAAGSLFIYHGARKGVLINYPTIDDKLALFRSN